MLALFANWCPCPPSPPLSLCPPPLSSMKEIVQKFLFYLLFPCFLSPFLPPPLSLPLQVIHPQVTSKIPLFNELILQRYITDTKLMNLMFTSILWLLIWLAQLNSSLPTLCRGTSSDAGLAADSLQCLQAMAATPLGLQRLWRGGTLEALAECSTTLDTSRRVPRPRAPELREYTL